ncbi:hypothetical protein [Megasphaera hominis]|jgi:hypothetical protein|uniref:Uncharacterized protein n=1 Tax=Megasphaera hominis TaxID=159836 RepID=A0ABR6VK95_9FIRM|nr:hypothetical protein [Megasphaera hominis]MBC3537172.1 hypothetical protein [Megasphaera hominis]
MALFTVAAHTAGHNDGFIRYNTETKELQLMLHDEEKEKEAREFLTKVHPWHRYVTLSQYETVNAAATDNLETLKLALGYIWLPLGVHIDWSRPVEDM